MPTSLTPQKQAVAWFGKPAPAHLPTSPALQPARFNVLRLLNNPVITSKEKAAVMAALFCLTAAQLEFGAGLMQRTITVRGAIYDALLPA